MPDPLHEIPVEQRVEILETIEDLPALGNTLAASDCASACFDAHACRIFSAVTRTFPKELQQVIRAAVVSLSDANAKQPLFEDEILHNRENDYNTTTEWEDSLPPVNFNGLDKLALRRALDLAKRAYLLSTLFLKTHLSRLHGLQPEHLAKSSFQFSCYPFRNYPAGKPYVPAKAGATTWVEEYRVRRAMWRLQLFSLMTEPKTRVRQRVLPRKDGKPHKDARLDEIRCVNPARQTEFLRFWSLLTRWEIDEILAVQDFLDASRISLRAAPSFIDTKIVIPEFYPILKRPSTSVGETDVISSVPELPPATAFLATPDRDDQHLKDVKDRDFIAIKRSTEAYNFFHRYGLLHPSSPLQRSRWENFRRLGFGVWNQDRMNVMELSRLSVQKRQERGGVDPLSIDNMGFTWRSVESQAPAGPDSSTEALEGAIAGAGLAIKEAPQEKSDDYFAAVTKEKKGNHSAMSIINGVSGHNKPGSSADSAQSHMQGHKMSKIERLYGINAAQGDHKLPPGPTSNPGRYIPLSDDDEISRIKARLGNHPLTLSSPDMSDSEASNRVHELHLTPTDVSDVEAGHVRFQEPSRDLSTSRHKPFSSFKNALRKKKTRGTAGATASGESYPPGGVMEQSPPRHPNLLHFGDSDESTLAGSPTSSLEVH